MQIFLVKTYERDQWNLPNILAYISGIFDGFFKAGLVPLREKSEYSRPGPITLFKALYLRNHMSDRQAVFFDEYHLDVKVVWHGYHIASVPVMARGACQTWGTLDDPQNTLPQ